MNQNIFRKYDIRGIVGQDYSFIDCVTIARSFARLLKQKINKSDINVLVGWDARLSSPAIAQKVISGLNFENAGVIDAGLVPTPFVYFGLYELEADGAVIITGSHNPPQYNGFKLCIGKETIYGQTILELKKIAQNLKPNDSAYIKPSTTKIDLKADYLDYHKEELNRLSKLPSLKIAIDSGNGTAGLIAPELYRKANCEIIELFSKPDGNFPNHHPDPTVPEYLSRLQQTVLDNNCDFGLAFDGDADRLGVIDKKGEIIWGDKLLAIFAYDVLKQLPSAKIIGEVKCSQTVFDFIEKNGGNPIMGKTGHSLIKAQMKHSCAVLAGEMSGHFFFADNYFGFDDAIYSGLRFIELAKRLKAENSSIETLLNQIPKTWSTPEIRVDCEEEEKFAKVEQAKKHFKKFEKELEIKKIIEIDGIRVVFINGWGLVRASNTQPALIMRFEGKDPQTLETIKNHFNFLIQA